MGQVTLMKMGAPLARANIVEKVLQMRIQVDFDW